MSQVLTLAERCPSSPPRLHDLFAQVGDPRARRGVRHRFVTILTLAACAALARGSEQIHVYLDHTTHGEDPIAPLAERWHAPDPKRSATSQARRYATWVTRPPGWQATHPDTNKASLRLGESGFGEGPETGWTPPPMTPRQADYLADLSRRAGVAVDEGLDVAEASECIAALIDAERHGHHHQRAPIEVPGRQRQRTGTLDPYLSRPASRRGHRGRPAGG